MNGRSLQITLIAALYFVTGMMGLFIAIPPGNVSPLWLPAGVALLGVQLLGRRIWPGLWIGSFAVNCWFYLHRDHPGSTMSAIGMAAVVAAGVVPQTFMGQFLLRRLSSRFSPSHPYWIFIFSLCVAPVSCIVNATWGAGALWLGGRLVNQSILTVWATWWAGDTAGMVWITTIGLIGIEKWSELTQSVATRVKHRTAPTLISLAITFSVTLLVSWTAAVHGTHGKRLFIGISRWGTSLEYDRNIEGFKESLFNEGFVEGKTVEFITESAETDKAKQEQIIHRLVQSKVALIYSLTTPGTVIAKRYSGNIPVIFSVVTYPVETGVIQALEKSGNQLVGTRNYISMRKQLEVFRKIFPSPRNIGFVHRKGEPNSEYQLREIQEVSSALGIRITEIGAENLQGVDEALARLGPAVDSLYSSCDTLIQTGGEESVIRYAREHHLPDFTCLRSGVLKGSLIGDVTDFALIGRMAGKLAAAVLNGTAPSDLKTLSPSVDNIVINLGRARELGLTVSQELLEQTASIIR